MCWKESVVSWRVCVCVYVFAGEVTHGGHSSGQEQLLESEVQPQVKSFRAFGDEPDPPYPSM